MAVTDVIDSIAICRLPMMSASVQRIHRRRFQTSPVTESVRFLSPQKHTNHNHIRRRERETFEKGILIGIASLLCCPVHRAAHSNTSRSLCRHCTIPLPRCIQPTANSRRGREREKEQTAERRGSSRVDRPPDGRDACLPDRENTDEKCYRHGKTAKKKKNRERERVSGGAALSGSRSRGRQRKARSRSVLVDGFGIRRSQLELCWQQPTQPTKELRKEKRNFEGGKKKKTSIVKLIKKSSRRLSTLDQ